MSIADIANSAVDAARSAVAVARPAVDLARETEITFLAAGVAFYAFFSVIPAVLLALAIGSVIGGEAFADRIVSLVGQYLSADGEAVVNEALVTPDGRLGASTAGVLALVWSTLKVFRGIDVAFDRIYGAEVATPLPRQLLNAAVVIATIVTGLGLMIGVEMTVGQLEVTSLRYLAALRWPFLVAGLTVVFVPLYYVMPPVSVSVREILPGTATAVVGWILLQAAFQVYAAHAAQFQLYGFVGVVLLFLLWLYFAAVILLFGAVVNTTWTNRSHRSSDRRSGYRSPSR